MPRFIAFYLPQYHPTPENDRWWGKGFTEWTNVAKAKPLFRGHYQPHIPADLGFYDLRLPEIREEQAQMARDAGVEGFMYWHYWFGNGKQILERPFKEVLESGKPDFPFCLGWANESWTNKSWTNKRSMVKENILLEQIYSKEDYIAHFNYVLPAFKDPRYIKVDGKPLFYVYRPLYLPDIEEFLSLWRKLAVENGLKGIHFVAMTASTSYRKVGEIGKGKVRIPPTNEAAYYYKFLLDKGFDAVNSRGGARAEILCSGRLKYFLRTAIENLFKVKLLKKYDQTEVNKHLLIEEDKWENVYPTIVPNWDRSPRAGKESTIYVNSTPKAWGKIIDKALEIVKEKEEDHQIVFIKSWNEWGEGNYVEPDLKYGRSFLDELAKRLNNK